MRDSMLQDIAGILQVICVMCKTKQSFSHKEIGSNNNLKKFPLNQDASIPM